MTRIMIIGDVHTHFDAMEAGIARCLSGLKPSEMPDKIVQVGDFGYYPSYLTRDFADYGVPQWFIRGNHEEHDALPINEPATAPMPALGCAPWEFIGDGYVDDDEVLYIGGAWSIDRHQRELMGAYRVPGFIDHWRPTEQMSEETIARLERELFGQSFRAIITHEAPLHLFPHLVTSRVEEPNRTAVFFDRLAQHCDTPLWCFGHHHLNGDYQRGRRATRFMCTDQVGGYFIRMIEV